MSDNTPVESLATDAPTKKPTMTDEERLELASKLDRELDEFIEGLEKRRYTDGWPEDKWQEEMDKHPFFMKKAPEPGDELHPLYEGMQKLKYDPEENTAEELAQSYKEDGTFYMKHKKFRMAIYGYSEGLKQKCTNDLLNAQLYNNRSAANYFLRNYRSSLNDAIKALELKPDYIKAKLRAAQCCLELERYDECIRYCEELFVIDPINGTLTDIVVEASNRKLLRNRNSRRRQALEKKKDDKFKALLAELSKRSITFCETTSIDDLEEKDLIPLLPPLEDHMVSINEEDGSLEWPLAFCYPEYEIMDFQQKVSENATIFDCLVALFEDFKLGYPGQYKADKVNVYHDNKKVGGTHKLDVDKTLKDILNEKEFAVQQGTLVFYVLVKDSDEEKEFLKLQRKPFDKYAPVF